MATMFERIKQGDRCWMAELTLRLAGLAVLAIAAFIARMLGRLINQGPPHSASPVELTIAAAACACLSAGLALAFEGAGLFRLVSLPPRAWLP